MYIQFTFLCVLHVFLCALVSQLRGNSAAHMRDVLPGTLVAYFSADTISYYCDGLPVCPSLRPSYLCDLSCGRASDAAFCCELLVPRAHVATVRRRAFSVVGSQAWNDLPIELHSLLMARPSKFYI